MLDWISVLEFNGLLSKAQDSTLKVDLVERIYLDNAATSWPKPESVYAAIENMQRNVGAPAGRGGYQQVSQVQRMINQTRRQLALFINALEPRNVAFTYSGTDSLCTAIMGLVDDGDHVVTSMAEHNSVLRPLRFLESQKKIRLTIVPCDTNGLYSANDVAAAIETDTKLVALTHVSNVTGAIEPVEQIGDFCRDRQTYFLLDAAQSIGHIPIDVRAIGCDLLAAPTHKGLLGPLGTGLLFYTSEVAEVLRPFRLGGTGTPGGLDEQPKEWPDKFEAGNLNVSGIAGVAAGLEFLQSNKGIEYREQSHQHAARMLNGLTKISRSGAIKLHGPESLGPAQTRNRIGVFSVSMNNMQCTDVSAVLDATWSIQTRAGLHCAPLMHEAMGTQEQGGTIRLSLGLFNTADQVDQTLSAISEIANA